MNSIKSEGLEPKREKTSKIFKTSLALVLIVFAFTMSSPSSLFQIVKPAEAAGTLTSIAILPTNNIVNTRTTYDIIFKTATTGTIKIIHMTFPSSFDVSAATRLIERSGIGSGSLSAISSSTLIYTVSSPVSVPAGTTLRLEIGRIINSDTAGSFKVSIATENTIPIIIDGPTLSPSFPIKYITGNDVSTSFMKRITLFDDATGNIHGWNPNGITKIFTISGISGVDFFESNIVAHTHQRDCYVGDVDDFGFHLTCTTAPPEGFLLIFTVINAPGTPCCSAASMASTTLSTNENNFSPPSMPAGSPFSSLQ